ncbi:MAG TPA: TIGR02206 family membrane protein [Aliicoccus persicus]|uniref:TIGR02206 family membrane protein n=1 Tax=Aliicoccus persicus TaxID=930138 RepID=A0A921DWK9_9STAP|nr:TIGR02206 family membrane protein [Aliicoccus persicus]
MAKYGDYITLFGPDHLIYIAGMILIAVLLFTNVSFVKRNRTIITVVILILSILQQIVLYGSYLVLYDFDLAESLPLHVSRINSILGIIYLITKNKKVFTVLALFSVFAYLSFLYPSRVYGITHPIGISFYVNHAITILLPFYGIIAYNETIKKWDSLRVFPWFVLYVIIAYITNIFTDGNYFYLKEKPVFPDLADIYYIPASLVFSLVLFKLYEIVFRRFQRN